MGAAKAAVDVIGHDALKYRALEDAIQTAIVGIEVIPGHRVTLPR